MRSYPRWVFKSETEKKKVFNESEEIQASSEGYESHFKPEIIEKRKGTDREILRGSFKQDVSEDIQINKPTEKPLTRGQKAALTRKKNKEKRLLNGDG